MFDRIELGEQIRTIHSKKMVFSGQDMSMKEFINEKITFRLNLSNV